MTTPIKATHSGIEITYNEGENKWLFELRGRERKADSLAAAKASIDKPEPQEKPEFKRIKCYLKARYGEGHKIVEVTSVAYDNYNAGRYFWVSDNGQRSKEHGDSLYPVTDANTQLTKEWSELNKREKAAYEQKRKIEAKFKTLEA